MEHFERELLEDQTKNRLVLHEHMEQWDKLIEFVACLLVFYHHSTRICTLRSSNRSPVLELRYLLR